MGGNKIGKRKYTKKHYDTKKPEDFKCPCGCNKKTVYKGKRKSNEFNNTAKGKKIVFSSYKCKMKYLNERRLK